MTTTILLVDDDQDVRNATRLRLLAAGYESIEAADGLQAIAAAIECQPDAILLDVRMPNMDGLTALAQLQKTETTRHIPVIMLSASLIDQTLALDEGARFFLAKPYDGRQLLHSVEVALATRTHAHTTQLNQLTEVVRP